MHLFVVIWLEDYCFEFYPHCLGCLEFFFSPQNLGMMSSRLLLPFNKKMVEFLLNYTPSLLLNLNIHAFVGTIVPL